MPQHKARSGECVISISDHYGFLWETVWNDPGNAELKRLRDTPSALLPGDVLEIPEKRIKHESAAAEQRHRFRRKGVPAMLRLRLLCDNEPRANEPYRLTIDGELHEGTIDGDGMIELPIPPGAQKGELIVGEGSTQYIYGLELGTVAPADTDSGVARRLEDLGYPGQRDFENAVRAFQADEGMEVTGKVNKELTERLRERFGL